MPVNYPSFIKLTSFQSFDSEGAVIDLPRRLNVFVGPNNVGKSKILQCFERLAAGKTAYLIDQSGEGYEIVFDVDISGADAERMFSRNLSGGGIAGNHWEVIGQHLVGGKVEVGLSNSGRLRVLQFISAHAVLPSFRYDDLITERLQRHINNNGILPFDGTESFFVAAERDITPEEASASEVVFPNGRGVTAIIQRYLLNSDKNSELVRKYILDDLNKIMTPNYHFNEILCQHIEDEERWEIYFGTEKHGYVALSQSGSGLKTILHLLTLIHLKLKVKSEPVKSGVYLFEELENSLHPRMQRNLYQYIRDRFCEDAVCVFSTHSPIAIDFFQADDEVSTYEVNQIDGSTKCRRINAFDDRVGALDSLGVKASDALQSNFVIWVEGPTDRIYLKKWIYFIAGDELIEGKEYVIMFYGGKLLSHLTVSEDDEMTEFIRLLKINPKCAVLIDSDRTSDGARVRGTKRRIRREANSHSLMCWVTNGREIENYIAPKFWSNHFNVTQRDTEKYEKIFEKVKGLKTPQRKTINTKIELAAYVEEHLTEEDLVLDWEYKTRELVEKIKVANS